MSIAKGIARRKFAGLAEAFSGRVLTSQLGQNFTPEELKDRIAAVMWRYVGIVRNEEDLKKGLEEIQKIQREARVQGNVARPRWTR